MEKCLLSARNDRGGVRLAQLLKGAGYQVQQENEPQRAMARLAEKPALWLIDAQLATTQGQEFLAAAEAQCRQAEVFCLLFSGGSPRASEMKAVAPWAAVLTLAPDSDDEVLARVRDQLSIRRLAYERDLAQARLLEKQREFRDSLGSAAQIQKTLLPRIFPELEHWGFAASFIPCETAGGDLYNVLQLSEDTVMAYLLDVSGHGVSSAMVTVSVYQSLSLQTGQIVKQRSPEPPYYRIPQPTEVLSCLDAEFPFERFDKFFTICYLLLDTRSGLVRYGSAGHPPPLLIGADGNNTELRAGGGIIGLNLGLREEGQVQMRNGDRLFLYSDGITEHMNGVGEFYGGEKLARRLQEQRRRPLATCCQKVVESLYDFSRKVSPRDDITLLGIEYRGADA